MKHPTTKTLEDINIIERPAPDTRVSLIDALDKVLEKGAVISGDVAIRITDVDLVYLGLRVLLTSISKAEELSGKRFSDTKRAPTKEELDYLARLNRAIRRAEANIPKLIETDTPEKAEKGLAQLVLTLVELLRRLLEREAMRRITRGSLAQIETEKLGMTLKALEKKIEELKAVFGIDDEELNLDLGPLGNLM